ncbi:MAG: Spy/CpxP family protein refolding chaperone [Acidobacteria bacterium]|nr:Spy/CpxP family protein refolding chaperone [Acidobacteriota bacterium]MCW5966976.1 Spy/CpxP family protein refolding chaperone [Blastocatellales bacterium]
MTKSLMRFAAGRCIATAVLAAILLAAWPASSVVEARQRGPVQRPNQRGGQGLAPGEKNPPNRQPAMPRDRIDPLNEQDRRDMRLVPPGVAFPRALIRVFRELDLTDEQRNRLENLARRSGNQMPALNRLRKAQSELLDEALYGENFDPQKAEARANDLAATQAEIIKLQARLMSQIRQILTPEQGEKFRELLSREREQLIQ